MDYWMPKMVIQDLKKDPPGHKMTPQSIRKSTQLEFLTHSNVNRIIISILAISNSKKRCIEISIWVVLPIQPRSRNHDLAFLRQRNQDYRHQVPGTRYQVPGTRYQYEVPGTRSQGPAARYHAPACFLGIILLHTIGRHDASRPVINKA